jgi:outer membrane immunogenic protein
MKFKMIRAGFTAAAILATSISAQAADLGGRYKAPAYSAPAYANWTGFYLGINGGYGFGKSNWTSGAITTGDFNVTGPMAGVTIGYNFQFGTWVLGAEGDLDYSWMKGSTSTNCTPDCQTSNTWLGTARARLGYAGWNNWLPYLTGGAAFGNIKMDQGPFSQTFTKIGWTAGVGLEYALWTNWSVKGEYLYVDLGTANCPAADCGASTDVTFKTNLVRLGLNYRF